jgi:hypothetical protein
VNYDISILKEPFQALFFVRFSFIVELQKLLNFAISGAVWGL